jgi:hypothetical protein
VQEILTCFGPIFRPPAILWLAIGAALALLVSLQHYRPARSRSQYPRYLPPDGHLIEGGNAPLTLNEKIALVKGLSQTLEERVGAQFKWLPVPGNSNGPIGYCGLVNIKNSRGGYVGFRRFFAMISKGPKGDYVAGRIEHIDPLASAGTGTEEDAIEAALTEDNCKEWGYTDFNAAS